MHLFEGFGANTKLESSRLKFFVAVSSLDAFVFLDHRVPGEEGLKGPP